MFMMMFIPPSWTKTVGLGRLRLISYWNHGSPFRLISYWKRLSLPFWQAKYYSLAMRSKILQITVNSLTEMGEIRDLEEYDLVEIRYDGNIIRLSRSALIELLGPQDGSQDSWRDTGPSNGGPLDGQTERPRPKSPTLSDAAELDFEEDRDLESTGVESDASRDSVGHAQTNLH
jgi:hypothetical protein